MASLADILTRVRIKARDVNSLIYTDAQLLSLANGHIKTVNKELQAMESNMAYESRVIDTVADTETYDKAWGHMGVMDQGVWVDGEETFLSQCHETDRLSFDISSNTNEPTHYYLTLPDDKDTYKVRFGLLPIPGAVYNINFLVWADRPALTAVGDEIPWFGLWDDVIEDLIHIDMLGTRQLDPGMGQARLATSWSQAKGATWRRGIRQRQMESDLFSAPGT